MKAFINIFEYMLPEKFCVAKRKSPNRSQHSAYSSPRDSPPSPSTRAEGSQDNWLVGSPDLAMN